MDAAKLLGLHSSEHMWIASSAIFDSNSKMLLSSEEGAHHSNLSTNRLPSGSFAISYEVNDKEIIAAINDSLTLWIFGVTEFLWTNLGNEKLINGPEADIQSDLFRIFYGKELMLPEFYTDQNKIDEQELKVDNENEYQYEYEPEYGPERNQYDSQNQIHNSHSNAVCSQSNTIWRNGPQLTHQMKNILLEMQRMMITKENFSENEASGVLLEMTNSLWRSHYHLFNLRQETWNRVLRLLLTLFLNLFFFLWKFETSKLG